MEEKSRKEKRKEARLAKQKNRRTDFSHGFTTSKKKKKAPLDSEAQSEDVAVEKKSKKKTDHWKKRKMSSRSFWRWRWGRVFMVSAEEDLKEMERRLAKKLKVKNGGNLGGPDDELNILLSAIPSALDSMVGNDTGIDDEAEEMEFMLETICDIKNKKKRAKEDPAHHTRSKKWLQKLRAEEDVLLRGLKWSKLLDPDI